MEDLGTMSRQVRAARFRKVVFFLLALYFLALMIYAIGIQNRTMPFFTRVVGFDTYRNETQINMRVFAIGMKEMGPLNNFTVRLDLLKPSSGISWKVFEGESRTKDHVNVMVTLPKVEVGQYTALLTVTHPKYGEEINEFLLSITNNSPPRSVDIQLLDEKYTRLSPEVKAGTLKPPLEIRLVANNGRYVPSLNNHVLVIAEEAGSRLPASGVHIVLKTGGKQIADLTTDPMGYANFEYYPHTLDDYRFILHATDKSKATFEGATELSPPGSQVIATPKQVMWAEGEAIQFTLSALTSEPYYIDMFHNGNWVLSTIHKINTAPESPRSISTLSLDSSCSSVNIFWRVVFVSSNSGSRIYGFGVSFKICLAIGRGL